MTTLEIRVWPDPVLTTPAKEVTEFNAELKRFVGDMHETMLESGGIGLAANQVGVLKRVLTILITAPEKAAPEDIKPWHDKAFTFINPVITVRTGKIKWQEGCLSFPEMFEYVDRFSEVTVRAKDADGKEFEVHADGLLAVCLQHEIDHLDGIVFVDRMSRLKAQMVKRKMLQKRQFALRAELMEK